MVKVQGPRCRGRDKDHTGAVSGEKSQSNEFFKKIKAKEEQKFLQGQQKENNNGIRNID